MFQKLPLTILFLLLAPLTFAQEKAVIKTLWEEGRPFPTRSELSFPNGCEHYIIHDCDQDTEYQFLHETAVDFDGDELVLGWYQNPEGELQGKTFQRTARSRDGGKSWTTPEPVTERGISEGLMYVGIQFLNHQGKFYAFSNQEHGAEYPVDCILFQYQPETKDWKELGAIAPRFLSMQGAVRMENGNYIIPGSYNPTPGGQFGFLPAVYVSQGDAITSEWKRYLIDTEFVNIYAETALLLEGSHLAAVTRSNQNPYPNFYLSDDYGRTWEKMPNETFPATHSKFAAGCLSNGTRYLIFNHPDFRRDENGKPILDDMKRDRAVLAIALAFPGDTAFTKIYKVSDPSTGTKQEKSHYPCAVERDEKLYISYTGQHQKRNAALTVIPISSLCP